MFHLTKKVPGVYLVNFDNHIDLCYAFLRYQEFYESPNPTFQNHPFTWVQYMKWYTENNKRENSNKHAFYYASDWCGFNIPLDIIKTVRNLGIPDHNHYDDIMWAIYGMISSECDRAYLIGVQTNNTSSTEKHELTHAAFYILPEYQKLVISTIKRHKNILPQLKRALFDVGYTESSILDEINAFTTTGDHDFFKKLDKGAYASLKKELVALHKKYYPAFVKDIK
jgi:hypothetical protein